jgi:hypothetical protein
MKFFPNSFFHMQISSFPPTICRRNFFSTVWFWYLVKDHLTIYVRVFSWAFYCVPLVYMCLYASTTLFWLLQLCNMV